MKTSMTIIIVVLITLILLLCNTLGLLENVFPQEKISIILKLEKFVLKNGQEKDGKMLWNKMIDQDTYNVIILGKRSLLFGTVKKGIPPIGLFFIASSDQGEVGYSYIIVAFEDPSLTILENKELAAEEFERVAILFYDSIKNQGQMEI